ncbi:hypothetical protein AVEN_125950-1, partial [Araneus ventricosus]
SNNQVSAKETLPAKPPMISIANTVPAIETSHSSASAGLSVSMLPPDSAQVHQCCCVNPTATEKHSHEASRELTDNHALCSDKCPNVVLVSLHIP